MSPTARPQALLLLPTQPWSGISPELNVELNIKAGGVWLPESGIAWWTSDIGGYKKGDTNSSDFRQLIVRWFQFGVTCPLFRQHGKRATEPWLFGEAAFTAIQQLIALRYHLAPYVLASLEETSRTGLPFNRPLWFDFPTCAVCWNLTDHYMVGSEMLAAPITSVNATVRNTCSLFRSFALEVTASIASLRTLVL